MVPFGERVSFLRRDPSSNKVDVRFSTGVWLGHARSSNEHWIGTPEGVTLLPAVRRLATEEAWSGVALRAMRVRVESAGRRIAEEDGAEAAVESDGVPAGGTLIKDFHITCAMVRALGATQRCKMRRNESPQAQPGRRAHSRM